MMTSRRHRHRSPAEGPLDDDDLLSEILLHLPPQPSSLPRASLVCKRWRRLASDPGFLRRFRVHHRRNPPLLGFLDKNRHGCSFIPSLVAPDRVPPGRFSLQFDDLSRFWVCDCRHGLILISDHTQHELVVWDPVTGDQSRLGIPPRFDPTTCTAWEVLRAAGDVHFQFQVVFVETHYDDDIQHMQVHACVVYSSETGVWGKLISTMVPNTDIFTQSLFDERGYYSIGSALLADSSLYHILTYSSSKILEFNFEKQSLAVLPVPMGVSEDHCFTLISADSGGLGFLNVSEFTMQLWRWKTDCDGVASWVMGRTIELDKLLSLDSRFPSLNQNNNIRILGFAEENNAVFMWTSIGIFVVQLQSLQFQKIPEPEIRYTCYPFESVFTTGIGGEHGGAELFSQCIR